MEVINLSKKTRITTIMATTVLIFLFVFACIQSNKNKEVVQTNANSGVSNKKIGWGIKREDNHKQPDVGFYYGSLRKFTARTCKKDD